MSVQAKAIIERVLKSRDRRLLALKTVPKKFLKVPNYVSTNPEYMILYQVKKLNNAYFVIIEGSSDNIYASVFAEIGGMLFELDEYDFEALGMNENLLAFYYENTQNFTLEF